MAQKTRSSARNREYTPVLAEAALYLALELSKKTWLLGFTTGLGQKPRRRGIPAGDLMRLEEEIRKARKRLGLADSAPVYSCYEAGREGFFPHRVLSSMGVSNLVVASSSIEVKRQSRRAKTDRLDVEKLLNMLVRYHLGDRKVWSTVRVPSVEAEDFRQLHRERSTLKKLRNEESNRIKSLLLLHGVALEGRVVPAELGESLERLRLWDGSVLPPGLQRRLKWELERLAHVDEQLKELERCRQEMLESAEPTEALGKIHQLMQLKSIGINTSWLLVAEFFAWREFRNRRQVGGASGLCGTPYDSGQSRREQGIGRTGSVWVRPAVIELAWLWLRWQPESALSRWYQERWGGGSRRQRRIGIVALARKLLIALWRFLEYGEIPEGARLRAV